MSSLDQTAISAVDLAIANSVEKETRNGTLQTETKANASEDATAIKQPTAGGRKVESPAATVSVLDHVGVSSVDLDVAGSVEKEVAFVKPAKVTERLEEVFETAPGTAKGGKDVEIRETKGNIVESTS